MKGFFTNMTFRSKILSVLLLTTILFTSFSFVFIHSMDEMNQVSDDLSNRNIPELIWLTHWQENLQVKEHLVETAIMTDFCCEFIEQYEEYQAEMDEKLLQDFGTIPTELENTKRDIDRLDFMITNEIRGLISFGNEEYASLMIEEDYLPNLESLRSDIDGKKQEVLASLDDHSTRLTTIIEESLWLLLLVTSVAILLAIVASYRISKDLTKPVEIIETKIGKIAKGQYGLTIKEAHQVELKSLTRSINEMSSRLKESFELIMDDKVYREQILNSLPIGIVTSDEKRGDIVLNDAAKDLIGEHESQMESFVGNPYERDNKDFWYAFSSKEIFQNVKMPFETNGEIRYLLVSQSQLIGREKEIIGKVFYFVDITETEQLEKKIQQTEKLAFVGELSAGAAHEIRNPLTVIDGFLTLMNQSLTNNQKEKFRIQLLLKELARINSIIEEMLLLTKPSAPKMKPTSLREIINDIVPLIQHAAGNEQVNFDMHLDSISMFVDSEQMKQVLHNLIRNSIEAMEGKGTIYISSKIKGEMCQIFVRDNGPGIPEKMKAQLFHPFLTSKESGTGLGLTIAQRILDNHEGKIELFSSSKQGTCFLIEVPLALIDKE
ncbi:sensor histidine kinase [Salipaludibacillus daqingensis]|uniref:sensor histidine kinase n=1 Tax=Salipaludibacillus daqingensis TaxID=3041001 RepID=UPI002476C559|nr:ATP-binding protein [Salipaludibacillus daqingensis]